MQHVSKQYARNFVHTGFIPQYFTPSFYIATLLFLVASLIMISPCYVVYANSLLLWACALACILVGSIFFFRYVHFR